MRKPTIQDVAREAGVHPGTVSRALNPALPGRVTDATMRRVIVAAERLGYHPDSLGRNLRTGRSHTVAVVLPDITNPVFPPIVRAVEETLRAAGYEALVANTDDDTDNEKRVISTFVARQVDGFIVASSRQRDSAVLGLLETDTPVVLVNRLLTEAADSVASDDAAGIRAAVRHLVGLGHVAIAHVTGPSSLSMTGVRRSAFAAATRAAGLAAAACPIVEAERYAVEEGRAALSRLLSQSSSNPTAVIAGNDLIAIGCYAALRDRGIRVPDEMSIVGFNDMPLTEYLNPPLTTVAIPQYAIGVRAAERILVRIADRHAEPQSVLLATDLVVRGSTGRPHLR